MPSTSGHEDHEVCLQRFGDVGGSAVVVDGARRSRPWTAAHTVNSLPLLWGSNLATPNPKLGRFALF
jgi:hypothetical protein